MKVSARWFVYGTMSILCLWMLACVSNDGYITEIEQWRTERLERLKQPRGWLSLAGLYPLKDGVNSMGFGEAYDIRLSGTQTGEVARVVLDSTGIVLEAVEPAIHSEEGKRVTSLPIDLHEAPLLHLGALYWTFLERSGQLYLRLWDTLSLARTELHEIPHFPVDPDWRHTAKYTPADSGTTIVLDDVLGLKRPYPVMGILDGVWGAHQYSIVALEGGPDELFLIFEDVTSGAETYAAGRYLYIPYPGEDGVAEIDFNKAYNPPCAFTEYATCLLAPPENRLPFEVRAGEKTYGEH
jgi:uncharacterized protein (DUF1684 family)